jgi:hypothetical protein
LVRGVRPVPRWLRLDREKHADRDLPVWHHLAAMDCRESFLVRDAHDGGFVTELRSDVCRMLSALYVTCFLRSMSHGFCSAGVLGGFDLKWPASLAWFLSLCGIMDFDIDVTGYTLLRCFSSCNQKRLAFATEDPYSMRPRGLGFAGQGALLRGHGRTTWCFS